MEILFFKNSNLNYINRNNEILTDAIPLVDEICRLVSSEKSLYAIFKQVNADGRLEKCNSSLYTFEDYSLQFGAFYNMQNMSENLKKINHLNLSFAPKLIKIAYSANNMYQLLVTKMSKNLVLYDKQKTELSFRQKTDFISDVKKLAVNLNLYNPCFFEEDNWFLDDTGSIFIQDWTRLVEFKNESEKQKFIQQLSKKLGLLYY